MDHHSVCNAVNIQSTETRCASVAVLKTIWERKEYRILPYAVLKHLIGNKALSELDKSLWLWLYAEAYFKENWSVKIPRYVLAEFFGKNERTISRSTKMLVDCGYLIITQDERGYQTYSIRMPKEVADHIILNTPDRKCPVTRVANEDSITSLDKNVQSIGTNLSENQDKFVNHLILNNINNTNNNAEKSAESAALSESPYLMPDVVECVEIVKQDQFLLEAQEATEKINQALLEANENIRLNQDKQRSRQLLQAYGVLEAKKEQISQLIANFQLQKADQHRRAVSRQVVQTDSQYVVNLPGERTINELQYRRLRKAVEVLGFDGAHKNELINQIFHEIRFGSLRCHQGTKDSMEIDRGINIALKLVREGRWIKPTHMEQNMEKISNGIVK